MRETREICGVEINLRREAADVSVRIGDTWLTAPKVAQLAVPRGDWSRLVRIDDFDFTEAGLAELQEWVADADTGGALPRLVRQVLECFPEADPAAGAPDEDELVRRLEEADTVPWLLDWGRRAREALTIAAALPPTEFGEIYDTAQAVWDRLAATAGAEHWDLEWVTNRAFAFLAARGLAGELVRYLATLHDAERREDDDDAPQGDSPA